MGPDDALRGRGAARRRPSCEPLRPLGDARRPPCLRVRARPGRPARRPGGPPRTRGRTGLMGGHRAPRRRAATAGTVALSEGGEGLRWLIAPEPAGTGISILDDDAGRTWGSDFRQRAGEAPPRRTFGPTWF